MFVCCAPKLSRAAINILKLRRLECVLLWCQMYTRWLYDVVEHRCSNKLDRMKVANKPQSECFIRKSLNWVYTICTCTFPNIYYFYGSYENLKGSVGSIFARKSRISGKFHFRIWAPMKTSRSQTGAYALPCLKFTHDHFVTFLLSRYQQLQIFIFYFIFMMDFFFSTWLSICIFTSG